jgi:hypothetical protein
MRTKEDGRPARLTLIRVTWLHFRARNDEVADFRGLILLLTAP